MGAPQLNIKDAETTRMVRELAELTGETQTEVVRKAVQEKLAAKRAEADIERRRREMDYETTLAEIRKIQAEVRKHMKPSDFLTDDDLYDEWGLPK
jgi:hypothetical protein